MSIVTPIVFQLGFGGIAGFIVGYVFKKLTKLIAIIAALFFIALIYLAYVDIIKINFNALVDAIKGLLGAAPQATNWIASIIGVLPFAGSFAVGLLLGFKMG